MKALFYYFFPFFGGAILFFLVVKLVVSSYRLTAYREFLRLKRRFRVRERGLRARFNQVLGLVLVGGMGVSWIGTGRFLFGLFLLGMTPIAFRLYAGFRHQRILEELERSSLSFFHALLGMVRVGKSFPTAILELTKSTPSAFSTLLSGNLKNFAEGKSLPQLLGKFRFRVGLEFTGVYLSSLEMAYRQGLSVGPLLEKMIPILESEFQSKRRIQDLRRSALAQGFVAFLIPWVLVLALNICEPDVFYRTGSSIWILSGMVAVIFEAMGVCVLWNLSAFY